MRSSSSSLFTPLTLLLLLASTLPPSTKSKNENTGDLIDQICKKTPFFNLCSATLHANPLTSKSDLKAMALIVLKDILVNATQTSYRRLEQSMAFCAECYIPIIKYTLPKATDPVNQGQFGFVAYYVGYTENEVHRCERKLAWSKPSSSLEDQNGIMHKLASVASAIIRLFLKP